MRALLEGKEKLAQDVRELEDRINAMEIVIDGAVVDLLALQQPVATDLRFILSASKITNDLERIGDHAVNIAESAVEYAKHPPVKPLVDIPKMGVIAQSMLRDAIDGFIHNNPALERAVLKSDDEIDALNVAVVGELIEIMQARPQTIRAGLELIRVSRNLERVADLATNIAEEVVFITEAQVVKHNIEEKKLVE
jgi:phosphate transport system protein